MTTDLKTSEGTVFSVAGMDEIEIDVAGDTRAYLYLSENDLDDMLTALREHKYGEKEV